MSAATHTKPTHWHKCSKEPSSYNLMFAASGYVWPRILALTEDMKRWLLLQATLTVPWVFHNTNEGEIPNGNRGLKHSNQPLNHLGIFLLEESWVWFHTLESLKIFLSPFYSPAWYISCSCTSGAGSNQGNALLKDTSEYPLLIAGQQTILQLQWPKPAERIYHQCFVQSWVLRDKLYARLSRCRKISRVN